MTEQDKEAAGIILIVGILCFIVAIAAILGHFFGAAIGAASAFAMVGAYLVACVAIASKRDKS